MGKVSKPRQGKTSSSRRTENVERLKSVIKQFNKDNDAEWEKFHTVAGHDQPRKTARLNRKQTRKDQRKLKKMRIHAFKQSKPLPTKESVQEEKRNIREKDNKRRSNEKKRKKRKEKKRLDKDKVKEEESSRVQGLIEANRQEDKMIRQLEKQLKMNRRKDKKKLPQSFHNDGLDYLLDVVDPDRVKMLYDEKTDVADLDLSSSEEVMDVDNQDEETNTLDNPEDSDLSEELDPELDLTPKEICLIKDTLSQNKKNKTVKSDHKDNSKAEISSDIKVKLKSIKRSETDEDDISADDSSDDEMLMSNSEDEGVDGGDDESSDIGSNNDMDGEQETKLTEDIYGRLRDEMGQVVESSQISKGAYVPPGKRAQMATDGDTKHRVHLERMRKQLKGLINRLSESSLSSISSQIEALFREHSRAEMSEALTGEILQACVGPVLIPERLIAEHMLLIAILHGNVGSEIGAYFVQTWAQRFESQLLAGKCITKEVDNLLQCAASLFNFKVIDSLLLLDVTRRLVNRFSEKDIELLLLLLKVSGLSLRRDAAVELKALIVEIQDKASTVDTSQFEDQSRVRFMLDVLLAVRNNNMRKIPNYDPSHTEHLRKLLRNYLHGGTMSDGALHIGLEELLQAETKGRWWLVGSAWGGRGLKEHESHSTDSHSPLKSVVPANVSGHILELARKQRMNTDVRKNIFCIIMTSEDFVDAFEKLLRLGLRQQQEREIIHVALDIAQQRIEYNPFYTLLTQRLAEYNRRFQMTVQFSIWDRLKELSIAKETQLSHLAKLLTHLIATKALSLSVFKVVEFGELDKARVRFMKSVISSLLTDHPEYTIQEVFSRIAPIPKLKVLREGLRLFMRHFLLRGKSLEDNELLYSRVNFAERTLMASDNNMRM